eukprot:m.40570 g.40570  ORF g.40570 m.40570 type:complete len:372 (+) comp13964_c0_seq1:85-1200(+)
MASATEGATGPLAAVGSKKSVKLTAVEDDAHDDSPAMRQTMADAATAGLAVRPRSPSYPDLEHTTQTFKDPTFGEEMRRVRQLPATEAKRLFFLNPADLKAIPCTLVAVGPYGRGTKCWEPEDLKRYALPKHGGHTGFQKKVDARLKRAATKRRHEEDADAHRSKATRISSPVLSGAAPTGAGTTALLSSVGPGEAELAIVRQSMRSALQSLLTWDHMRSKRAPNGCWITGQVQVPGGVTQAVYAALIGQGTDPELRGMVKRGAWYSALVPFSTAFGGDNARSITGRGGRYNGNADLVVPNSALSARLCQFGDMVELKYCPGSRRMSIGAEARNLGAGLGGKSDAPLSEAEAAKLESIKASMRERFPHFGM